jgi:hypothetical protein
MWETQVLKLTRWQSGQTPGRLLGVHSIPFGPMAPFSWLLAVVSFI